MTRGAGRSDPCRLPTRRKEGEWGAGKLTHTRTGRCTMQTHLGSHVPQLKDKNIQTHTHTSRQSHTLKSISSENTHKHTLGPLLA